MADNNLRLSIYQAAISGELSSSFNDEIDEQIYQTFLNNNKKRKKPINYSDLVLPFEIPKRYKKIVLGDLIDVISGTSYSANDVCDNSEGIRILRGGNIQKGNLNLFGDDVFVNRSLYAEEKNVKKGDIILVASTGSSSAIGKSAPVITNLENCQIGAFLRILRCKNPIFQEWVSLITQTSYYHSSIVGDVKGININNIKNSILENMVIPLPSISEQKYILEKIKRLEPFLEEFDRLDETRLELNNIIKPRLRKSIIKAGVLGTLTTRNNDDTDVNITLKEMSFESNRKFDCSIGEDLPEIPTNWRWVPLNSIVLSITAGGDKPGNFSKIKTDKYTIPVVSNGEINEGIFGYTDEARINCKALTISGRGTIGYSKVRNYPFTPIVRLLVIKPLEKTNLEYLAYAIESLSEYGNGSAIKQLTVPMIYDKLIPFPSIEEQKRIVKKIDELLAIIEQL